MYYLITHGERLNGKDPSHTPEGRRQIRALNSMIKDLPIQKVIVGTGSRFQEMLDMLDQAIHVNAKIQHSIFCGSSEGIEKDNKTVVLNNGRQVPVDKCIGLIDTQCFDPWRFIEMGGRNSLFLAGGELMFALGLEKIHKKGHLFRLDPKTKQGTKLS